MVFIWILSDNKFPQLSSPLLSILANFKQCWGLDGLNLVLISNLAIVFLRFFGIVPVIIIVIIKF